MSAGLSVGTGMGVIGHITAHSSLYQYNLIIVLQKHQTVNCQHIFIRIVNILGDANSPVISTHFPSLFPSRSLSQEIRGPEASNIKKLYNHYLDLKLKDKIMFEF